MISAKDCKHFRTQNGTTLIEILLYLALISTLVMAVLAFFSAVISAREKAATMLNVDQQSMQIMQQINQEVRSSDGIASPLPGESAGSLSLSQGSEDSESVLTFSLEDGRLVLNDVTSEVSYLNSGYVSITELSFKNVSRPETNDCIRIQFTISHVNPDGRSEMSYTKNYYGGACVR